MPSLPTWELHFDADGRPLPDDGARRATLEAAALAGLTDLLVFAHGWNNDAGRARRLYDRLFALVGDVLASRDGARRLGAVGVHWPAMLFPDAEPADGPAPPPGAAPGSAALSSGRAAVSGPPVAVGGRAIDGALRPVFPDPAQQDALTELTELLDRRPADAAALHRFARLLTILVEDHDPSSEDDGERALFETEPMVAYGHLAALVPGPAGAALGLRNPFDRLWDGAKEALRTASYYTMKERAGHVGEQGLGPFLRELTDRAPGLRVHLAGHSFGARLVSFALRGLPDGPPRVASLGLVQGAFSHFAFAAQLPFDPGRGGALQGAQRHVSGPLLATYSRFDLAVGRLYPAASLLGRSDAAGLDELAYRWGAVGHDGFQAVPVDTLPLGPVGSSYPRSAAGFVNLDAEAVIRVGAPPSGAHGDILHPELAWALVSTSGP